MTPELWTCRLGTVGYKAGVELQRSLRERVRAGELPELLLLLEHPPVYTLGRRSEPGELPLGEAWYRAKGIDVVRSDRGGKVTYHGPGQLVGYPIMRVEDVVAYVETMQAAIIAALAEEGIAAHARPGREYTGAWVEDRKIASIGVHLSRGLSMHGFAVNVDNDLTPFDWVVACGLGGVRMTSVVAETGVEGRFERFTARMTRAFAAAFGREPVAVAPERLGALAAA